jgi:hypothetical protein
MATDWHQKSKRWKSSSDAVEQVDEAKHREAQVTVGQNALDVQWLEALLTHPKIDCLASREAVEAGILRSLEWLNESGERTLNPSFREKYERLSRLLLGIENGRIVPRPDQKIEDMTPADRARALSSRRKAVCARAAAQERAAERKAKMPAWIDDPSKLPKKPPSAARKD